MQNGPVIITSYLVWQSHRYWVIISTGIDLSRAGRKAGLEIGEFKSLIIRDIDNNHQSLGELSGKLHDNPEVAFQEYHAAAWLTEYLVENGFSVDKGICKLPTAFQGSYGSGKPVIAFLAEYDALPGVGHACGHNLIATSSVAAAVAGRRIVDELGGSIAVFGTPGEELYGGKAMMAERGAFDNIDIAMITHPGGGNRVIMHTLAVQTLDVEFTGKAAHAAAQPEVGINALEAMILSYNAINSLRQHIREKARIHGIITNGGEASNVVPAHSAASFMVRSDDDAYLDELKDKVIDCFLGAAKATGAKLEYRWGEARYATMLNNLTMAKLFKMNFESLGHEIPLGDTTIMDFSTDVGNVSRLVPTIQALVAIAPSDILIHSEQFAEVTASEEALDCLLDAAKAMAMTAADIMANQEIQENIQRDFREEREVERQR
jgi:amidohydrolase